MSSVRVSVDAKRNADGSDCTTAPHFIRVLTAISSRRFARLAAIILRGTLKIEL